MIASGYFAIVIALACPIARVFATPTELITRRGDVDDDWTVSPFVMCMQSKQPGFPAGTISQHDVLDCHDHGKRKRSATEVEVEATSEYRNLSTRDMPSLYVEQNAECTQQSLPNNFLEVSSIRSQAATWCNQMKNDLIQRGAASVSPTLGNAVTKSASELHGHKSVILNIVLGAYPPALAAFKTVQGIDTTVVEACTQAVTTLATKGQGCTKEINWYNAGKAKGQTSTGALPGSIDVVDESATWFSVVMDFLRPS